MIENLELRNKYDRLVEFFLLKFYFNIRDFYKLIIAFFGMYDFWYEKVMIEVFRCLIIFFFINRGEYRYFYFLYLEIKRN